MNRRAIAPLIRARQELWKRVERLSPVPRWRGAADTLSLIDSEAITGRRETTPLTLERVARTLRARAASRYPVAHLRTRDIRRLGDAGTIVQEAERILGGDWDALGTPVRVTAASVDWRAHPVSLVPTPPLHFSRVSYAADVIGGDVKYLWEVNRHAELVRLAQAYWLTRRAELAEAAVALIESWMAQNPPGLGINWISAVDVAFRTIAWCWVWSLTADCDVWTDERVGKLIWMVAQCGRFIARYDSVHHSPNTHLTGEALGLIYIGTVFPELRQAARWRALGIDILGEEVPHQFLEDGMHYERCTGYHRYHLEFYLHALAIANAAGESWADAFREPISRAADAAADLRRPDGSWPVLGDEDGGVAVRLGTRDVTDQSELLVTAAGLLRRPELRTGPEANATNLAWWLLDDAAWRDVSSPAVARTPVSRSFSLGSAGYYGARDDWTADAWYCVVDAGPHGGNTTGHAHTDLGHVEVAHGPQWITVDPGCSVYTSAPERRTWYRGQRAHGTVLLDDTELAIPAGPFGWRTVSPTPARTVSDDGSHWHCRLWYTYRTPSGLVDHERQVVLIRSWGVIVCDFLAGGAAHGVTTRWPLVANIAEVQCNEDASTAIFKGCRIQWWSSVGMWTATVEATRRSPKFGAEVDASALVLSMTAAPLPLVTATVFTAETTSQPRLSATGGGMTMTIPETNGRRAISARFRAGVAPDLKP